MRFLCGLVVFLCCFCGHTVKSNDEGDDRMLQRFKRVIGGDDVAKGDWPWLVHVNAKIPYQKFLGIPISYVSIGCTGSLIGRRWVLTAAHCFKTDSSYNLARSLELTPKYWHAKIGEVDWNNSLKQKFMNTANRLVNDLLFKSYFIHASKIILHPKYDPELTTEHDIALLKLEQEVEATYTTIKEDVVEPDDHLDEDVSSNDDYEEDDSDDGFLSSFFGAAKDVATSVGNGYNYMKEELGYGPGKKDTSIGLIRLANGRDSFMEEEEVECVVIGWGCEYKGGPHIDIAKKSDLRHISMDQCRSFWPDLTEEEYVCAGGEEGICSGDSGGPLVCKNRDEWVQIGVSSFSNKGQMAVPSVFTKVSNNYEWIMDVMEKE